jgi:hypothetical protein
MHREFDETRHLFTEIEMILKELIHLGNDEKYLGELQYLSNHYVMIMARLRFEKYNEDLDSKLIRLVQQIKHFLMGILVSEEVDEYYKHNSNIAISMINKVLKHNKMHFIRDFE